MTCKVPSTKKNKNLGAVPMFFTVLPSNGKEGVKLVNVKFLNSSSYSDITEAIIVSFMQSAFSNNNREIDAVYTYRF